MWREKGYNAGSTLHVWLSNGTLPPWLPGFPPKTFPTAVSFLLSLGLSPCSLQPSSPWDFSPIPMLQLPATHSGGLMSLSMVDRAMAWIVWVVLTPLILSHSALPPESLKCFLSAPTDCPLGVSPLLHLPHCTGACSVHPLSSSFSLTPFILPSFVCIRIFLSGGQGLLPALSWCSVRSSVYKDTFLLHLWRKMYFMSTYTFNISSFPCVLNFALCYCCFSWCKSSIWQGGICWQGFWFVFSLHMSIFQLNMGNASLVPSDSTLGKITADWPTCSLWTHDFTVILFGQCILLNVRKDILCVVVRTILLQE